jgi:hypothetical protein
MQRQGKNRFGSLLTKPVLFLPLYGDSRHPPKARQGFWRMLAWLVTLSTVAARSLPLPFSLKKDRKYIEKCRKL